VHGPDVFEPSIFSDSMKSIGIVFKKNEMIMVAARHGISRYFLDGYRILPFLDSSDDEKEAVILNTLERFLADYRGARANIFAALPRSDAFIQYVHLPLAAEEDVYAAAGYEIDRYSPFGSDDVYYDCHVVRRMPESGLLYVLLIIVQRAKVDYLIELFKKLKIRLQGVELTTTALVNGYAAPPSAENGFDPAALARNVYVRKALGPLARRFPALAGFFDEHSENPAPEGPAPVMLPVEYLDNEHYELNIVAEGALHYSRVFACTGRTPDEAQLHDMLRHGRQACIHLPFDQVEERPLRCVLSGRDLERDFPVGMPPELAGQVSIVNRLPLSQVDAQAGSVAGVAPLLSVPAHLALKGLKPVGVDMNLIPPALRPRRRKSKRVLVFGAAVCLLACAVAALALRWDNSRSLEQARTAVQLSRLEREYKVLEAQRAESARMEKLYESARRIAGQDVGKLKVLRELTEIIPENAWLTEFNYRAARSEIRLSGYAVSASQLLPVLEQSDMFENVRFTSPITTDQRLKKEQFRLEMKIQAPEQEAQ